LLGFALSDELQATTTLARAAIGGLLGLCVGVMLGAVIQTVDDAIDEWLNSLNSK
jgi:ABC-type nitrate/sulfonate/bicarbonate transport system permease component